MTDLPPPTPPEHPKLPEDNGDNFDVSSLVSPKELDDIREQVAVSHFAREIGEQVVQSVNEFQGKLHSEALSGSLRPDDLFEDTEMRQSILTKPTPLDHAIAANPFNMGPEAMEELHGVEDKMIDLVSQNPENRTPVYTINRLHHIVLDKENSRIAAAKGEQFYPGSRRSKEPRGYMAREIVEAFPDPGELLREYNQRVQASAREVEKRGWTPESALQKTEREQSLDSFMSIMYGERYEAYKLLQEPVPKHKLNQQTIEQQVDEVFKGTMAELEFGNESDSQLMERMKNAENTLGVTFSDRTAFNRLSALYLPGTDKLEFHETGGFEPGQFVTVEAGPDAREYHWTFLGIDKETGMAKVAAWDDKSTGRLSKLYPIEDLEWLNDE